MAATSRSRAGVGAWLAHRDRFQVSPDLPLMAGWVPHRAPSALDSPFPHALADTAPDRWGERVIRRAHARRRTGEPGLAEVTAFDLLAAVAVIRRFDRTAAGARLPYLSGGSLLQARRDEDRSCTELADAIRAVSPRPLADLRELWRRLLVNHLLTNTDDHLWNVGFLYAGNGQWALAPAFDVNPFPDRVRESKTWLSEDTGPVTSLVQLLAGAGHFGLTRAEAERMAGTVGRELARWPAERRARSGRNGSTS